MRQKEQFQSKAKMSSLKDLTVILVTHNSEKIIKQAISNFSDCKDLSIIIVDNASTDKTIEEVESLENKNIQIIRNAKNSGFARANNIALRQVKAKYTLLINPDCIIKKDSIEKVLSKISNHKEIAILSAELHPNETISHVKKPLQKLLDDDIYDVKFISGCCMFFNMSLMKKIGFFDEGFFLYCEDNELCKRILNKKFKLGIVKDTKVLHLGGQSSGEFNEEKQFAILWHRFGWSKCYYTELIHCKMVAKFKALRDIIRFSLKVVLAKICGKKPNIIHLAKLSGSFAYFIGKKAFDKNGNPVFSSQGNCHSEP